MWRRISLLTLGVILLVTVTSIISVSPGHAQGDSKPLWRVITDQYCTEHGYVGVEVDGSQNNVFGLGCKDSNGILHGMNMVEVCRYLYGDAYLNPQYTDFNNPDSWRCYQTQGPAPTAVPPPPTSVAPPTNPPPVIQPQQPGETGGNSSQLPQESEGNQSGGMDIGGYCRSLGYPELSVDRGNAFSWSCAGSGKTASIDMYALCQWEFGGTLSYPGLDNPGDAWTWSCNSQPVNVPSQTTTGTTSEGPSIQPPPQTLPEVGYTTAPSGRWVQVITERLNVRSGAGATYPSIAQAPYGSYFDLLETDPDTGWHHVSWGNGEGWVSGSSRYTQVGGDGSGISILITLPGGNTFSLQVVYDATSCVIQNGADLTIMEILMLIRRGIAKENWPVVVNFLEPRDSGVVEQIRHSVENAIAGLSSSCSATSARYQIGNQRMDLSGPGNVVFGFVMGAWGQSVETEDLVSNRDQTVRDLARMKLSVVDEADDLCQRRVGRALALGGSVSTDELQRIASNADCSLNQ